ncbi:MAG: bifunctional folylpolyglutamate synthase/dihydrofolate synthase, partial [Gammaproteobacteria bacterium]|nr:bifunctional folylpolyglutamate synthase/dihydrofolate synthase [Gammaproteobacteria bacterium]
QIATEKAGIIRAGKPVVCSESPPPQSVLNYAVSLNSCLYQAESDFKVDRQAQVWHWSSMDYHWYNLPFPALTGAYQIQNAAAVLQVISLLISQGFKIREEHIKTGLISVRLAGRFQQIPGDVEVILDVTHNQQGAENLVKLLLEKPSNGRTIAVIAMLKDKDISAVVSTLKDVIDFWYVAGIDGNRGMSGEQLAIEMTKLITNDRIHHFNTVVDAYQQAKRDALFGDRILVFGSFHTVEAVLRFNTINEMK